MNIALNAGLIPKGGEHQVAYAVDTDASQKCYEHIVKRARLVGFVRKIGWDKSDHVVLFLGGLSLRHDEPLLGGGIVG